MLRLELLAVLVEDGQRLLVACLDIEPGDLARAVERRALDSILVRLVRLRRDDAASLPRLHQDSRLSATMGD